MAKREDELVLHSFANPRRIAVDYVPVGDSMTRQEFTDECDINQIMTRYEANGIWPVQMGMIEPRYVDYTAVPQSLQETLAMMQDAQASFMTLPASVRREFDNDPVRFVEFAADPGNADRLRGWGLAEPLPVEDAPQRVVVVGEEGASIAPKPADFRETPDRPPASRPGSSSPKRE